MMCIGLTRRLVAIATSSIFLTGAVCLNSEAYAQQPAQSTQAAKPAQIDKNGLLILIRTTLIALDQANKTGLYTVLRDISSPAFQINTAAKLSDIFAGLRRDKIDLSAAAVLEPQLTLMPQIAPNGLLQVAGFYPAVGDQIFFELAFAPVEGQWRLFGISVRRGSAAPVAPQAQEQTQSAQPKPAIPAKK